MAEEHKHKIEEKETKVEKAKEETEEAKPEEIKTEEKKEGVKLEDKIGEKKEKKEIKKEVKHPHKTEAFALGNSLPISTKQSKEISRFISGKNPDKALELLERVMAMKISVPFRGEIPHRRGKIMSGRYPITALGYFIRVLKSAVANASLHDVDVANSKIHAKADMASRPRRRFGSERFKRTNVKITIKENKSASLINPEKVIISKEKPKAKIKQNTGVKQ